jgi:hypothetical protein
MMEKDHWMQHVRRRHLVRKTQKFSLEGRLKQECCHVTTVQDREMEEKWRKRQKKRKEGRIIKNEVGIRV